MFCSACWHKRSHPDCRKSASARIAAHVFANAIDLTIPSGRSYAKFTPPSDKNFRIPSGANTMAPRVLCDYSPMKPGLRKLTLTAHIVLSVGWLGSVAAYLALAIAGLNTNDPQLAQGIYPSMELIARYVIVPFSIATVGVGLLESLGTPWGLFRQWWVLAKFALATIATAVLLKHVQVISEMASTARSTMLTSGDFRDVRIQLVVHAVGGLLVLLSATALSVYKPWGLTPFGKRVQERAASLATAAIPSLTPDFAVTTPRVSRPRWVYIVGFHAIGLVLLVLIAHLTGIRPHGN